MFRVWVNIFKPGVAKIDIASGKRLQFANWKTTILLITVNQLFLILGHGFYVAKCEKISSIHP